MPDDRRLATLLAFAQTIEVRACDDVLDMLQLVLRRTRAKAERRQQSQRLRTLHDLDAAALKLAGACRLFLDANTPLTRDAIFATFPREQLLAAIAAVEGLAHPPEEDHACEQMLRHYSNLRRFLPLLMETITFDGADSAKPVLAAWEGLRRLEGQGPLREQDVDVGIVPASWRRYVLLGDGAVDRRAYTLCVLDRLHQGLRRRDVYVRQSKHWGDTRALLLQGEEWTAARPNVSRMLSLPSSAEPFAALLREELDQAYRRAAARFADNRFLRIVAVHDRASLVLTPLDAIDEPDSLSRRWSSSRRYVPADASDRPVPTSSVTTSSGMGRGSTSSRWKAKTGASTPTSSWWTASRASF